MEEGSHSGHKGPSSTVQIIVILSVAVWTIIFIAGYRLLSVPLAEIASLYSEDGSQPIDPLNPYANEELEPLIEGEPENAALPGHKDDPTRPVGISCSEWADAILDLDEQYGSPIPREEPGKGIDQRRLMSAFLSFLSTDEITASIAGDGQTLSANIFPQNGALPGTVSLVLLEQSYAEKVEIAKDIRKHFQARGERSDSALKCYTKKKALAQDEIIVVGEEDIRASSVLRTGFGLSAKFSLTDHGTFATAERIQRSFDELLRIEKDLEPINISSSSSGEVFDLFENRDRRAIGSICPPALVPEVLSRIRPNAQRPERAAPDEESLKIALYKALPEKIGSFSKPPMYADGEIPVSVLRRPENRIEEETLVVQYFQDSNTESTVRVALIDPLHFDNAIEYFRERLPFFRQSCSKRGDAIQLLLNGDQELDLQIVLPNQYSIAISSDRATKEMKLALADLIKGIDMAALSAAIQNPSAAPAAARSAPTEDLPERKLSRCDKLGGLPAVRPSALGSKLRNAIGQLPRQVEEEYSLRIAHAFPKTLANLQRVDTDQELSFGEVFYVPIAADGAKRHTRLRASVGFSDPEQIRATLANYVHPDSAANFICSSKRDFPRAGMVFPDQSSSWQVSAQIILNDTTYIYLEGETTKDQKRLTAEALETLDPAPVIAEIERIESGL